MTFSSPHRSTAVLAMPGTGFDSIFADECFHFFADFLQLECFSAQPDPHSPIRSLTCAINHYMQSYDLILAGISISGAIAIKTLQNLLTQSLYSVDTLPIKAIIAALPAWTHTHNTPQPVPPAHISAQYTSSIIDTHGIDYALTQMKSTTPPWLSHHLQRSWKSFGNSLSTLFQESVNYPGPSCADIATLPIPLITIGACDDPIHPAHIAQEWAQCARQGLYRETSLERISISLQEFSYQAIAAWKTLIQKQAIFYI